MDIQEPFPTQAREGPVARMIEQKTAKIPSDLYLWAAIGAMGVSAFQQLRQPRRMRWFNAPSRSGQLGLFFGQWAPTLLILGIYNKLVKLAGGSDRETAEMTH
jgi:hypothetical protein